MSAYLERNDMNFIMQQDNDLKHTANITKDFIWGGKVKCFRLTKSPDLKHVKD